MKDQTSGKFSRQVDLVRAKLEKGELAFTDCLSVPLVMQVLKRLNIEFRQTIYVPWVTLWTFLTQVMHAEHTCRFSLSVGTVLDYAIRPYSGKATGELVMLREVTRRFTAGNIALGDRGFVEDGRVNYSCEISKPRWGWMSCAV